MQAEQSYYVQETNLLQEASDSELIDLIKRDHLPATNVLINRYRPYVVRIVKQRVAPAFVEDLTQDVLLKVFVSIKKFEQRSLLTTWLYRITLNHLFQHKTGLLRGVDATENKGSFRADHSCYDVNEEAASDVFLGMTLCMDGEQRMVITLADIFKLDHHAASKIMKITPANFRKRLSRSRKELKNFLTNQCSLMNPGGSCKCKFKTKSFQEKEWLTKNANTFKDKHMEAARTLVYECVKE